MNANVRANHDPSNDVTRTSQYCKRCGAWKGQLGLEPSPMEYIEHLCMIFDEVRRVLKPTGACWVNLGDTYSTNTQSYKSEYITSKKHRDAKPKLPKVKIVREKSLVQIPARFAIAMSDRGWILRNECIWHKPNAMPVSVKDRFTVDFEKFFFFTKEPKYYFKQQLEPVSEVSLARSKYGWKSDKANLGVGEGGLEVPVMGSRFVKADGRNKRTIWTIPTSGSHENHVAMFPVALVETPIRACCPEGGTVLDPFCGSGTTLEYCARNNVNGIGIEINPDYKSIIDRRSMINLSKLEDYS